ncbi:MAG: methylmalonyl-CoA epimerase [Thaumarchaeota archaeon]|nr:MAG: methylmalonyl-CoA epimerase [Nitrososphaerota archaeon]
MKLLGLDHIAIAVKNLDEAIDTFKKLLGIDPKRVEEVTEEKVKIAIFDLGNITIELLQGTSPESTVTRFVEKHGEGLHHVAIRVEGIDEVCKELASKGFRLVYPEPRVVAGGERRIEFIHPKTAHGVLIELVEKLSG